MKTLQRVEPPILALKSRPSLFCLPLALLTQGRDEPMAGAGAGGESEREGRESGDKQIKTIVSILRSMA